MNALTRHGAAALLWLAAAATCGGAAAAPADVMLPPPGLYRIDTISTMSQHKGRFSRRTETDGATGEQTTRTTSMGQDHDEQPVTGAPVQRCIASVNPNALFAPLAHSSCKDQRTQVVGKTVVHTAQCVSGTTVVTMRKIDERRWALETRIEMGSTPVQIDLRAFIPALEHEARHGATLEARAKARAQLAALPGLQRDTNRARADMLAKFEAVLAKARTEQEREMARTAIANLRLAAGSAGMNATIQERWTRIADSCSRSPAPPPG